MGRFMLPRSHMYVSKAIRMGIICRATRSGFCQFLKGSKDFGWAMGGVDVCCICTRELAPQMGG